MNLIEVVHFWPPPIFIQRHAEALNDHGLVPTVVMRKQSQAHIINPPSTLRTVLLPSFGQSGITGKLRSVRYLMGSSRSLNPKKRILLSLFKTLKPDLIHFHDASLASKMQWIPVELDIPYTFSLRGSDIQVLSLRSQEYIQQLIQSFCSSAGVHSVCNNLWDQFIATQDLPDNLFHQTIYTNVPLPDKLPGSEKWESPERHFITVGRVHWTKAYPNLLIAFKRYLDQNENSTLTIVGDGSDLDSIHYWIHSLGLKDRVHLSGKMNYDGISRLFARSHAYIQSSITEGFSNSVAEAMAYALPVFATNVGGTSEVIRDGENGFLLNAHRPEDWWRTLTLVEDKQQMITVGQRGRETALQTFSAQKHAADFITFFNQAIENGRHKRMAEH
jgi:colanic acid/amylovoran biosynthesis glycosyltransferase